MSTTMHRNLLQKHLVVKVYVSRYLKKINQKKTIGLDGNTPAEASGIDLELGHDKIKDLITKSVESKGNFAVQLGKRIEKVNIVNEKDSIKVTCKGWM